MVYEDIEIIDPVDADSVDPFYGMEIKELDTKHIDALKDGKYLYTTINDEYTILIKLAEGVIK